MPLLRVAVKVTDWPTAGLICDATRLTFVGKSGFVTTLIVTTLLVFAA